MKLKRIIASILLACMALSMVACGSDTTSTPPTITPSEEITETNPYGLKAEGAYSCSDEPVELSVFVHYNDAYVITDNMPITNEVSKYTNVVIRGAASEYASNSATAFNLIMADPVLPDLIGGEISSITQYGIEKAFIPLNDLIDEHAPDIARAFELYPEALAGVTAEDGSIYAIPFIYENPVAQSWWIRQDWLETLNLEVPTNIDEFEAVLTAFRNDDPNGNGIKDEIPFFMRLTAIDNRLYPLLSLFGISDFFHDDGNGNVKIGSYSDDLKDAMVRISQWYADGLIDTQIWTRDGYVRDELYPDDNGGITHDWIPSTSAYNNTIAEYVDGFNVMWMAPPADVNGDVWEVTCRLRLTGRGTGVSVDCEDPVAAIKLLNFYFTDMGRTINTYGVEGETYYIDDEGKPMFTDEILNGDKSVNVQIFSMGGQLQSLAFLHDNSYEYVMMHECGVEATEAYVEYVNKLNLQLPALSFTTEENNLITSKWPTCRAYMLEKMQVWCMDGSRIEAEFDEYMNTLRTMGIEEVLAAYQSAYDRFYS